MQPLTAVDMYLSLNLPMPSRRQCMLCNVISTAYYMLITTVGCVLYVCSAYEIIKLKGYTSWAIGIMVSTLCNAILKNQHLIYALSTFAKVSIMHHTHTHITILSNQRAMIRCGWKCKRLLLES